MHGHSNINTPFQVPISNHAGEIPGKIWKTENFMTVLMKHVVNKNTFKLYLGNQFSDTVQALTCLPKH